MKTKDTRTVAEIQTANVKHFLKHGPGFSTGYITHVVARNREKKAVLVGGLGGCGVGLMWFAATPGHALYAGWDDAPEADVDDVSAANAMREAALLNQYRSD